MSGRPLRRPHPPQPTGPAGRWSGAFLAGRALALVGLLGLLAGCAVERGLGDPVDLRVFAAASLTEAFESLAPDFEAAQPGYRLVFNFAGSDALATQLLEGARADVFAAADERQMARLIEAQLVEPPRTFVHNRLALITALDLDPPLRRPSDLSRPGLRLVLAGPEVPAGRYAREALRQLGAWPAAEVNLVSEELDVKGVVGKVLLGEADAGMVYVSDVTPAVAGELSTLALPPSVSLRASYPAARLRAAPEPAGADAFLDFLFDPQAVTALRARGFETP